MKTTIIILLVLWLLYKSRWDIIAVYIDWVEPKYENDDMSLPHIGVSEEHDYESLKKLIAGCTTKEFLNTCFVMIDMFQEKYKSFTGLQRTSNMWVLYEQKEAEIKVQTEFPNAVSIESSF